MLLPTFTAGRSSWPGLGLPDRARPGPPASCAARVRAPSWPAESLFPFTLYLQRRFPPALPPAARAWPRVEPARTESAFQCGVACGEAGPTRRPVDSGAKLSQRGPQPECAHRRSVPCSFRRQARPPRSWHFPAAAQII